MKKMIIKKIAETRTMYTFTEPNAKGEKISFEIEECTNPGGRHSLPYLWNKNGFTSKVLNTYLTVNTYVTDETGCHGRYNPTIKLSKDRKRAVLNFKWILENTEENKQKLIDKITKLAF